MERTEVVNRVALAMFDCVTARGVKITENFTKEEILDFANTVVAYLPPTLEYQVTELAQDLTDFADKETFLLKRLKGMLSTINLVMIMGAPNDDKENTFTTNLQHLLFQLILTLNVVYKINVDEVLENMLNYHRSLLLTADELKENVELIQAKAVTVANTENTLCVRINDRNDDYIPTIKTLTNFNQLTLNNYEHTIRKLEQRSSEIPDATN